MRLVIIDQDINYIKKFREVIMSVKNAKYLVSVYSNLNEINKGELSKEDIILIDEFFITELNEKEEYKYLKNNKLVFLVEEKFGEEVIRNIANILNYTIKENISDEDIKYIKKFLINKYMAVNKILEDLREKYIFNNDDFSINQSKKAKLISLYSPYSTIDMPEKIEKCLDIKSKSILLVQTDAIYNNKKEINFSYILLSIKRGKRNISKIIKDTANKIKEQVDVISGPDNIQDLDYLNKEEIKSLCDGLIGSAYDYIVINLCGMQVTKNIYEIIKYADENILCSTNEQVQKKILEQIDIEWSIDNRGNLQVVKDIIEL